MSLLRCPFLARQPMSMLRSKSTLLMNYARKCPVMSRVLNSVHPVSQLHSSGIIVFLVILSIVLGSCRDCDCKGSFSVVIL